VLADTIVAESSAAGAAERAVVRVSGPRAREVVAAVFAPPVPAHRGRWSGTVLVRGQALPAYVLGMPAPHSFTGEDVVELHVPGGSLFVQCLLDELLVVGAPFGLRLALPGEFTARACQNGRLDAAAAEGILLLLHAADARELGAGVQWLRGGLSRDVAALRNEVYEVLAWLEAGFDFGGDETGPLPLAGLGERLTALRAAAAAVLAEVPAAAPGGELLLLGASNAGKSSLCNALSGQSASLVAASAGTTRDLLRHAVGAAALWDAPGDLDSPAAADALALALRDRLAGRAAGSLWVVDASAPQLPVGSAGLPCLGVVWTKVDLATPPTDAPLPPDVPVFATSATTGTGLGPLRAWLQRSAAGEVAAGAPVRRPLQAALAALERALPLLAAAPELAAAELHEAARHLAGVDGQHGIEPLLDRIYGRFCLGK
jgi:tRNA modification GTPase